MEGEGVTPPTEKKKENTNEGKIQVSLYIYISVCIIMDLPENGDDHVDWSLTA